MFAGWPHKYQVPDRLCDYMCACMHACTCMCVCVCFKISKYVHIHIHTALKNTKVSGFPERDEPSQDKPSHVDRSFSKSCCLIQDPVRKNTISDRNPSHSQAKHKGASKVNKANPNSTQTPQPKLQPRQQEGVPLRQESAQLAPTRAGRELSQQLVGIASVHLSLPRNT